MVTMPNMSAFCKNFICYPFCSPPPPIFFKKLKIIYIFQKIDYFWISHIYLEKVKLQQHLSCEYCVDCIVFFCKCAMHLNLCPDIGNVKISSNLPSPKTCRTQTLSLEWFKFQFHKTMEP